MAFSLTPLYTPLVVFPITTCLLGIWQLYRLKWKLNLLHQSEVALASPPLSLDSHFETIPVLTRVVASGHLDPPPPFLVGPRTFQGEPGYNVIYPFTLTNGKRILVNLGWIQKSMRNKYLHSVPNASLYLNVEGMLYPVHALRPLIKLRNDPERNEWVWCDVDRMSQLANTHPMFMQVQATLPLDEVQKKRNQGEPIPPPPQLMLKNDHLGYAMTWFSLSCASTLLLLMRKKTKKMSSFST